MSQASGDIIHVGHSLALFTEPVISSLSLTSGNHFPCRCHSFVDRIPQALDVFRNDDFFFQNAHLAAGVMCSYPVSRQALDFEAKRSVIYIYFETI